MPVPQRRQRLSGAVSRVSSSERMDELGMWVKGRGVALSLRGALVRKLMGRQVRGGLSKVGREMLKPAG